MNADLLLSDYCHFKDIINIINPLNVNIIVIWLLENYTLHEWRPLSTEWGALNPDWTFVFESFITQSMSHVDTQNNHSFIHLLFSPSESHSHKCKPYFFLIQLNNVQNETLFKQYSHRDDDFWFGPTKAHLKQQVRDAATIHLVPSRCLVETQHTAT